MKFKLQNIALGYYGKSEKENTPIYNTSFFNIDGKAISYEPKDIPIPGYREFAYPFIQAINFDSTNGTFNYNQDLFEQLNKIKLLNKLLFKVLEGLLFKKVDGKIKITKKNFASKILSILNNKTFLLEVKQDIIDNVISWIYTLGSQNPGLLTAQELEELGKFYNGKKIESIKFPIVNKSSMKNRLNLTKREKNIITNEGINGSGLLEKGFLIKDFKMEVGNILLNTDLTGEIRIRENKVSYFSSTTPRLSEGALDTILN